MPSAPQTVSTAELLDRYPTVLLDSFGVLVDGSGPLPGAIELISHLEDSGHDYLIVTNDSSRLHSTTARRYQELGLAIPEDRILTSGQLIGPHFEARGLAGASCLVLGTRDSEAYVREAGGEVLPIDPTIDYEVIVVADDAGYEYFEAVDAALSAVVRRTERGEDTELVLPNPDLIYPKAPGQFGFTAGSVALLLEAGFRRRLGNDAPRFTALGKPNAPIYQEALKRSKGRPIMIGDQLETDIAGAARAGIDTALLTTGVTRWREGGDIEPTYLLPALALD